MGCNNPLKGWFAKYPNQATGKRSVVFSGDKADKQRPIEVPCGKCLGCQKKRSVDWAIRCVHESRLYNENSFITLTYHPKYYPKDLMLHKEHFQKFMKRLRKQTEQKIRFIHCGEYGPKTFRAHYHALIFNIDFKDKQIYKRGKNNDLLYESPQLNKIWGKGMCLIGDVSFESAQYIAKYINKSQEVTNILENKPDFVKPYNTMSRRLGIGIPYLEKYWEDIYPIDHCIMQGGEYKPPRAYDKWMEQNYPRIIERVKRSRLRKVAEHNKRYNSSERDNQGYAREQCMKTIQGKRDSL